MTRKALNVLIDEELYNWLKSYSEEKHISMREALEQILRDYSQPASKISPKGIILGKEEDVILHEPSKCALCGRDLKPGYHVKYYANLGHVCLRCYYSRLYSKALADKYLKKRELEATIRALRKKADELAKEVAKLEVVKNTDRAVQEIGDIIVKLRRITIDGGDNKELEELLEKIEHIEQLLSGVVFVIEKEFKISDIEQEKKKYRAQRSAVGWMI